MLDECVTTKDRLAWWIEACTKARIFGFDTETSGLDIVSGKDVIVGFCLALSKTQGCYIPIGHKTGEPQLDYDYVLDALAPLLAHPKRIKIAHNFAFDDNACAFLGLEVDGYEDTMLMSYALDTQKHRARGHGFDALTKFHMKYDSIRFEDVVIPELGIKNFSHVRLNHATKYASEDARMTVALYHDLLVKLEAEGLSNVYEDIDRPLAKITADMKRRGIGLDLDRVQELHDAWCERIVELQDEIDELTDTPINLGSPKQLGVYLYETLKLPVLETTESGSPSTDDATLEALEKGFPQHPVLELIREHRSLSKLTGSFTKSWLEKAGGDGRIHGDFKIATTNTRRLASSDPNCIHGDALVYVLDPRGKVPMKSVRPGDWVWSYDDNLRPVPGLVTNWKRTAQVRDLVRVTVAPRKTNRGSRRRVILVTPDHQFRLRDGRYVEARTLRLGDSLLALERVNTNGYRQVEATNLDGPVGEHQLVAGIPAAGFDVHHKNDRRDDNRPCNLEVLSRKDHRHKHHPRAYAHKISATLKAGYASGRVVQPARSEASADFYNHEVVGVEVVHHRQKQSVYDITVSGTHNFIVEGVCVHNCQNIPANSKEGKLLREVFVAKSVPWAPKRKRVLIGGDLSQAEYRMLAHDANCKPMLHMFANGHDFHAATAAQIFGGKWEQYADKNDADRSAKRSRMKNVNFANIYGASAPKIAAMTGISEKEAYRLLAEYDEAYPEVGAWKNEIKHFAHKHAYAETLFGGRVHVPHIKYESQKGLVKYGERQAVNGRIQGSCADYVRIAMAETVKDCMAFDDAWLLLQVHDELIFECYEEDVDELLPVLRETITTCTNNIVKWRVKFESDVKAGNSWASIKG